MRFKEYVRLLDIKMIGSSCCAQGEVNPNYILRDEEDAWKDQVTAVSSRVKRDLAV